MAIFWADVERRDVAIKRSLQKNLTRPMPEFRSFPKELNSDLDEEEEEAEDDRTKSVVIASDNEGKEVDNPPSTLPADDTTDVPPLSTEQMTEQDRHINKLMDNLTKSDDVPIHSLKRSCATSTMRANRLTPMKVFHQCIKGGIPTSKEYPFDPEIERTLRRRRKEV
ncbi:ribosomal RNA-processing protein 17-like [Gossypium hirsutum]|uniref:Ribosomal RNA-processing protein 17-like n=1 Tax=Gossypium hirsutum TaxID=3635 RepID=A0A1U8KWM0_GOSHI|nr:ribosomal RNA-processing protein 17-like [Gossypium hirsutum]